MQCPYYEKLQGTFAKNYLKGYCQGHPAGGMMVPSLMEERKYCLKKGGYVRCPIYLYHLSPMDHSYVTEDVGADVLEASLCSTEPGYSGVFK